MQLACQPARLPKSDPPGPKALAPRVAPPPWGVLRGAVRLTGSQIWTPLVLVPPQTPLHPRERRRRRTRSAPSWGPQARPSARKGEAVPQAPLPPPSCTPPPAGPRPARLAHPSASRSLASAVASSRWPHTPRSGRPVRLTRFARRCGRTPRRTAGGKFPPRKEEGRGGAGRRGGRKSAWRKGRGGGPCSPTGSRWGGRSQGPPPPVLTTTLVTKHP